MVNIADEKLDELISQLDSEDDNKTKVSKNAIDLKETRPTTIPDPVVSGSPKEIGLDILEPLRIPKFLMMHPALPRGIEIKANRMIKRTDPDLELNIFENPSDHSLAKEAREYCKRIMFNSDSSLFLKKFSQEAYRFGTSFFILQTNVKETEVIRFDLQNSIFFGPASWPLKLKGPGIDWGKTLMEDRKALAGKKKIDLRDKKIAKFTQFAKLRPETKETNFVDDLKLFVDTRMRPDLKEKSVGELVPVGDEFDRKQVVTLAFDTMGDSQIGIPLAQFLHLTIKYLLDMERGAAQTQVNFGFNKWVANTPYKDIVKMQTFAGTLAKINTDAVVVLPRDIDLKNIAPGTTDFDRVHPIFLNLIAIRLGIPTSILTQDGSNTNKATIVELRKDMQDDFIADELTVSVSINEAFLKAIQIKWPDQTMEEYEKIVPFFKFKPAPEDKDLDMERNLRFSLMIRNFATAAKDWAESSSDSTVIDHIGIKINSLILRSLPDKIAKDIIKANDEVIKKELEKNIGKETKKDGPTLKEQLEEKKEDKE